jgi:nucleotide-binding universal stress UspA family protein
MGDEVGTLPMRVSARLSAVVSFAILGILALVFAGLLDWIVGVLFLLMEFLGQFIRSVFRRPAGTRPQSSTRHRPASNGSRHSIARNWGIVHRKGRPRRRRAGHPEAEPAPSDPPFRVLVPLSFDDPALVDFALEECRIRRAELLLLFLRPLAVMPMGPIPLPGLAEDEEARATFDRVGQEADRLGVPWRTFYEATADRPSTIGEVARNSGADVVIVGSVRKGGVARFLARDPNPTILKFLPERASLLIHAS